MLKIQVKMSEALRISGKVVLNQTSAISSRPLSNCSIMRRALRLNEHANISPASCLRENDCCFLFISASFSHFCTKSKAAGAVVYSEKMGK